MPTIDLRQELVRRNARAAAAVARAGCAAVRFSAFAKRLRNQFPACKFDEDQALEMLVLTAFEMGAAVEVDSTAA
jgi:hypothetical protein